MGMTGIAWALPVTSVSVEYMVWEICRRVPTQVFTRRWASGLSIPNGTADGTALQNVRQYHLECAYTSYTCDPITCGLNRKPNSGF
jgi:hypothetical protein